MRPRNEPEILTVLLEETKEKFSHLPPKVIEQVIAFKWKNLHAQFSKPNVIAIEDAGIGTFKVRFGALRKELSKYKSKFLKISEEFPTIPPTQEKRIQKYTTLLESLPQDIHSLETKLELYEQRNPFAKGYINRRGIQESSDASSVDEGIDTGSTPAQDGDMHSLPQ